MLGVSKLVATVTIVAVALIVSIIASLWISGLTSSYASEFNVRIEVIEGIYVVKTFFIDLRNTGSIDTSITHVFINQKPARLIWAWDLDEDKYLGCSEPIVKSGHTVRIAIRSPKVFVPGSIVEVMIYTSHGLKLFKYVAVTGHTALAFINNGGFHTWNYNPGYMLAIYRDYYMLRDNGLLPDVPLLSVSADTRSVREYCIEYNMWYALLSLYQEENIIMEIAVTNGYGRWEYIDLEATRDGSIAFYTSYDDYYVKIHKSCLDPHSYKLLFRVYRGGIVEVILFIDGEKLVDRNTSSIYGWFIGNLCIGVWDKKAMYDMYLDKFQEHIDWVYYNDTVVYEEFNTSTTNLFTSYTIEPEASAEKPITSYPVVIASETLGFEIEPDI